VARSLEDVVSRIVREVGLPKTTSARIAKKLNNLAKSVEWATPVPEPAKPGRPKKAARGSPVARLPKKPARASH
jgi:hypothetical protein